MNPDGTSSGCDSWREKRLGGFAVATGSAGHLAGASGSPLPARESQAFDELIRDWQERLFYYIRRLVGSEEDAWDVLQQTWLRVFKGIRSLRDPDRISVWLYQLARSAVLSHWRGHYRKQSRLESDVDLMQWRRSNRPNASRIGNAFITA